MVERILDLKLNTAEVQNVSLHQIFYIYSFPGRAVIKFWNLWPNPLLP